MDLDDVSAGNRPSGEDRHGGDTVRFGSGRRLPRPVLIAIGVVLAAVVAVLVILDRAGSSPASNAPSSRPPASTLGQPVSAHGGAGAGSPNSARSPQVLHADLSWLHASSGWELFARGEEVVVRIQVKQGRVTRTPVPSLASSGPVSFIVGKHKAVVHPTDNVPDYVVPDGRPGDSTRDSPTADS